MNNIEPIAVYTVQTNDISVKKRTKMFYFRDHKQNIGNKNVSYLKKIQMPAILKKKTL